MDYATARQVFFQPAPDEIVPLPMQQPSPARRLRDAAEPIAILPAWASLVNQRLAERGLNFLTAYVWGRAVPLGEPVGAVVAAAFGAFEPGLIINLYDEARRTLSRAELLRVQEEATIETLQNILGPLDSQEVNTALRRAVDSADGTGRPMFSAVRALGWPTHPLAQLWRGCNAIREHRGDSHIAAYIGAGFDPVQMNILTELWAGWPPGSYSGTRAWPAERTEQALSSLRSAGLIEGDSLTSKGREVRQKIEEQTDAMEMPLVEAIGADLEMVVSRLNEWGEACIKAGEFPPDPRKRAAG
ncbi:MAG TPA: hypothetical protein VH186_35090 [Chloroflexia bacterium]|nr:hypothetical protein [Chloroflexia bacterium]